MKYIVALFFACLVGIVISNSAAHQYHSQFLQDKYLNEVLFKYKKGGVFVEIGAYDGIKFSNSLFFERSLGWKGICIEPSSNPFKKLVKNRRCICINACISDYDGQVRFLHITPANNNGTYAFVPDFVANQGSKLEFYDVACYKLSTILKKHKIRHVDYVSIDVEGSELKILESIDFSSVVIDVFTIENPYENESIRNFMRQKGYVLLTTIYPDEVYVRADFKLETAGQPQQGTRVFGGASVSRMLFDYIRSILPDGRTLLELGSGSATADFAKYYTVYSIEHDRNWLNKYPTNYIYAPIRNGWYDVDCVKNGLPAQYDCILIDGPLGTIGRYGFYTNLALFRKDVPYIFDDVNRPAEYKLMCDVALFLQRSYTIFYDESGKQFGVVLPS